MTIKEITYFDRAGSRNTPAVIDAVKRRAEELGIQYIVVASNRGKTGLMFSEAMEGMNVTIVSVTEHAGFTGGDEIQLTDEMKEKLEKRGVKTLVCSHALSGVGRSISKKFGGVSHVEMIAYTLRQFGGEGIKVAVEVTIMAADAGLIPTDREVIAVGGTKSGADAAIVVKPAHMNNFFDLEIREIICKPRVRR